MYFSYFLLKKKKKTITKNGEKYFSVLKIYVKNRRFDCLNRLVENAFFLKKALILTCT